MPIVRRQNARRGCFAVLVAAAFAVGGCTSSQDPPDLDAPALTLRPAAPGEPALDGPLAHVDDTARLPLAPYTLTSREVTAIDQGRLVLIDRCMRRFGFRYQIRIPPRKDDAVLTIAGRYGLTDAAKAARLGYRRDSSDDPAPPVKPKLTKAQSAALFGDGATRVEGVKVPHGGCLDEANRELDRDLGPSADVFLGQNLIFDAYARSKSDTRVVAAFDLWSACMVRQGYDYAEPFAPFQDESLDKDPGRGITVAVADVTCKRETRLVDVWYAVESAYQRRLMSRHTSDLTQTRQALRSRISAAEAATDGA